MSAWKAVTGTMLHGRTDRASLANRSHFAHNISTSRYNIYCNYPPTPDSGGKHWKGFFYILLACMIVAQLTLVGFLVLKASLFAIPFLVPLLVISILFILYLYQYKLPAAHHLPTGDCVAADQQNRLRDFNFPSQLLRVGGLPPIGSKHVSIHHEN